MKRILLSLVAIATISLSSYGQVPEGFKYQAVVRDAGNLILNNQAVGMRMTIQQGSIGGTTVYQETFALTTNGYGLVNLEIGNGTVVSGTFATIAWSAGPYFLETAIDVTGGTSYVVMGTSQLMSVPYALHAKTAENVTNDLVDDADSDPTNELQDWTTLPNIPAGFSDNIDNVDDADNDPTNEIELPIGGLEGQVLTIIAGTPQWVTPSAPASNIQDSLDMGITPCQLTTMGFSVDSLYGKTWAGGLIFYFDKQTCEGLVAGPIDLSSSATWGCDVTIEYGVSPIIPINNVIVDPPEYYNPCPDVNSASQLCSLPYGGYNDWFLPTIGQLGLMHCFLHLRGFGDFVIDNPPSNFVYYWSSTSDPNIVMIHNFKYGRQLASYDRNNTYFVRAVRAF